MMKWKSAIAKPVLNAIGLGALATVLCLTLSNRAIAHGVSVTNRAISAIQVQAVYDTGEPMDKAQVTIYAPDNPQEPWMQGLSDDRGQFLFVPDLNETGTWTVKIRKAGHGSVITIPIGESGESETSGASTSDSTPTQQPIPIAQGTVSRNHGTNALQKAVMMASVFWGCTGTALFFSRSGSNAHS
ncbi:hypothetical protein [Roseofilum casamattae]|uniref:Carboxypeptidase regulatory-like domain-containing protein n=1 Tax=Roseofilum casamattae BLCC-M143 TaxID=3022442 RepID=A0ABT7BST7_9CYAN|nr:hypothetical protein [Roseofilum casamattae]MDJ1182135.1 carboxypeptidase regulatory-like domain-containing protein [Roseofilum casamattae BLCC-M143]